MKYLKNFGLYFLLPFIMGSLVNLFFGFAEATKLYIWNDYLFEWQYPDKVQRFTDARYSVDRITKQALPLSVRDQQDLDRAIEIIDDLARENYIVAIRYIAPLNCDASDYSSRLYPDRGRTFALIGGSLGDMLSKKHLYACLGKF